MFATKASLCTPSQVAETMEGMEIAVPAKMSLALTKRFAGCICHYQSESTCCFRVMSAESKRHSTHCASHYTALNNQGCLILHTSKGCGSTKMIRCLMQGNEDLD